MKAVDQLRSNETLPTKSDVNYHTLIRSKKHELCSPIGNDPGFGYRSAIVKSGQPQVTLMKAIALRDFGDPEMMELSNYKRL